MENKNLKLVFAGYALASMLAIIPVILRADDTPNDISSASSKYSSTSVFVGGTPIMRVRFAAGGMSAEQRASAIQLRVNKLLGQGPIHPEDITVEQSGTDAVVLVKGQLLFTADQQTAGANQTTTLDLAQQWATNMRQTLPDLTQAK